MLAQYNNTVKHTFFGGKKNVKAKRKTNQRFPIQHT